MPGRQCACSKAPQTHRRRFMSRIADPFSAFASDSPDYHQTLSQPLCDAFKCPLLMAMPAKGTTWRRAHRGMSSGTSRHHHQRHLPILCTSSPSSASFCAERLVIAGPPRSLQQAPDVFSAVRSFCIIALFCLAARLIASPAGNLHWPGRIRGQVSRSGIQRERACRSL